MDWYTIKDGLVTNFIVASQGFIDMQIGYGVFDLAVDSSTITGTKPDIGWSYTNGVFSRPADQ